MAGEPLVIVNEGQFGLLRQHCANCPEFNEQPLCERMVVVPYNPSSSNKRKRLLRAEPRYQSSLSGPSKYNQRSLPLSPSSLPSPSPSIEPGETQRQTRLRWKEAKESFLRNVPKASEWRERQIRVRSVNVEEYERIIQAFTSHSSVNLENCASLEDVSSVELVHVTFRFALLTKSSLANANLQTSFSSFQALILLSLCAVLEKIGIPYETVDRITQYISNAEEYQRKRLRKSAVWINHLIAQLSRRGWTIHRATELFFLNALSLTDLRYIRHKENLQCILNHLTTEDFLKYEFGDCLWPEYTIPGLIAYLFKTPSLANGAKIISIDEICAALGYDLSTIPSQLERIHTVRPATASKSATSTSLNFCVTVSGSLRGEKLPPDTGKTSHSSIKHNITANIASFQTSVADLRRAPSHESSWPISASHTPLATPILPLFYAMGGYVPKVLLDRAISAQQRADEHGKEREVTPNDTGLHKDLIDLLLNDTRLKLTIEHLISLSIITLHEFDGEVYVCSCESARISYEQSKEHWIRQAFVLCCYAFPRNPSLHSTLDSVGMKLSGIVRHLTRLHREIGMELPPGVDTVETLLSASRFGPLSSRIELLTTAANMQKDAAQTHLQAEIVYRQSVLLRLKGYISDSEHLIHEFLRRTTVNLNQIPDHLLALLHLSQANNQAYHFDFSRAHAETLKWRPSENAISDAQLDVVWDQLCCAGRFLRGEGRFNEAKYFFEHCLATAGLRRSKGYLIKSHLADLYCELQYIQRRSNTPGRLTSHISFLEMARGIIQPEIEHIRACGQSAKALRRLLLSLAEIEIMRNQRDKAEYLIKELLGVYNRLTEPDICDRLGHVRALIACARISPLHEAEGHWQAALLQNRLYNPLEEEVFTCGVIYLSIATVRFELGDVDGGKDSLNRARDIIIKKRRQFLIPGVGTYLVESAMIRLQSMGWRIDDLFMSRQTSA